MHGYSLARVYIAAYLLRARVILIPCARVKMVAIDGRVESQSGVCGMIHLWFLPAGLELVGIAYQFYCRWKILAVRRRARKYSCTRSVSRIKVKIFYVLLIQRIDFQFPSVEYIEYITRSFATFERTSRRKLSLITPVEVIFKLRYARNSSAFGRCS